MAKVNPSWGAPRIHGELLRLGFDVSERTVSNLMPRRPPNAKPCIERGALKKRSVFVFRILSQ
jgi:hypothetical protein